MRRYICIHGHFYQPPRENPWTGRVELQDSALPYHDWNERVTAECYGPNARARILDGKGRIARIASNYARMSFNFGPTLLAWMEENDPELYEEILAADRESRRLFSDHGSALAQAYNHMILPLASRRDKRTQVRWGARDFEVRFRRRPEGMWLPETAVDTETLEALAEEGIAFTILAPHQARRIRPLSGPHLRIAGSASKAWRDVSGGRVDPKVPFLVRLPSGRKLTVFFYDGPIAVSVAFEKLLESGDRFLERLLGAFDKQGTADQLVHVATDGETYGHHHRFGDMALAYALERLESDPSLKLTNYGEFLAKHPPAQEVEIVEESSWSCAHGVERWRAGCGCRVGGPAEWSQAWRTPLRDVLDWLRDAAAEVFEDKGGELLKDPWAARDAYVDVIAARTPESVVRFFAAHGKGTLSEGDRSLALALLEMQRNAQLMYTSCGWFFDDPSGLETTQILRYAGRVVQLSRELSGRDLRSEFLRRLERIKSNIPEQGTGRSIFERAVLPSQMTAEKAAAHYAMRSFFEEFPKPAPLHSFVIREEDSRTLSSGHIRMTLGLVSVSSETTLETVRVGYGFLHFGDHNMSGGTRLCSGRSEYESMAGSFAESFSGADFPEVHRRMERAFGASMYSLKDLFRDEQLVLLSRILEPHLREAEAAYDHLYAARAGLLKFLTEMGVPQPKIFQTAAGFSLNRRLRDAVSAVDPDWPKAMELLSEIRKAKAPIEGRDLAQAVQSTLQRLGDSLRAKPDDAARIEGLAAAVALAKGLPDVVDLSRIQNDAYALGQTLLRSAREKASKGDPSARLWVERFLALADALSVTTP